MTSGKPLLSTYEPLSAPNLNLHPTRISSFGCLCRSESLSSSVFDDTSLSTKEEDDDLSEKSLEHSASIAKSKEFNLSDSRLNIQLPSECPLLERKRMVSWGGALDLQHNSTNFEVASRASSRVASSRVTSSRVASSRVTSSRAASSRAQFEVSRASSQAQDKLSKSQRVFHKSMQFDDNLSHEDNPRLIHISDPKRTNDKYEFTGNEIRTSKYTFINFLPKNIFIQFHRVAYLYFLAIAALNQLPPLAVFGRTVSLFPLLFVLCVTAIKDGYEDWRRHRSDRNENNKEALVLQSGKFLLKKWKKIQAGEVLKICADETIPCDMVLLGTSDPSGLAYIQTMNLDGESNLKTRYARQETTSMVFEGGTISGVIRCEQPNRNIYEFTANMELKGQRFSLSQSNIVLRGCQLKNTEWVVGVVVYAGQETKAMLNSAASPSKRSRLETYMNRETLWLSVFLFIMCLVVALGMLLWLKSHKDHLDTIPYYKKSYVGKGKFPGKPYKFYGIPMETFFSFLSSIIVFQIMIPISLYITMELVRLGQSYFMIGDANMYDSSTDSRFQCRSLNINEDLGQIRYVFSDKTGTLTENKMEFQRASVYGKNYGSSLLMGGILQDSDTAATKGAPVGRRRWKLQSKIAIDSDLMDMLHKDLAGDERIALHEFFLALAACNTVIPMLTQSPSSSVEGSELHDDMVAIAYQGESPDEQALVAAASAYGYTLFERTSGHIVVDVNGEKLRLEVLGLHEFDSVRKRMSVVIRFPSNDVKVLVKGADTSMLNIINKDSARDDHVEHATRSHLNEYSSEGLRTLVVAAKDLTGEELEEWQCMYEEASTSLTDRSIRLRQTAALIECNLRLLGATGIEDKLQDGVPEAIEALRQAGIKVWVLTGDKQETAISIGLSCKLLTADMHQIVINGNSEDECKKLLSDAKARYSVTVANCRNINMKAEKNAESDSDDVLVDKKLDKLPHWYAGKEEGTFSAPLALIIDGNSLVYILEKDLESEA
ncbi:hypothetical protein RJ640_010363 [Escallonia rubra]|uniref:Phospholipid-transporting ATPase n=1 Tax=Escallonia rubra TaxID=112253 RepID=A0AA88RG17_9ASTE|nr:hypothetical protein RJ640_010363 [Escallonia rubra]